MWEKRHNCTFGIVYTMYELLQGTLHNVYTCPLMQNVMQDLLAPEHDNLQLREGPSGVYVEGVREEKVADIESCLQHLQIGDRNRSVPPAHVGAEP